MTTMKAVRVHRFGSPEGLVYEDVPTPPQPTVGQVLIQVYAAGVGYWDGEIRRGEWQGMFDYPLSIILGTDVSGLELCCHYQRLNKRTNYSNADIQAAKSSYRRSPETYLSVYRLGFKGS